MQVKSFQTKDDWYEARQGKIGGSSAYDVYSIKEATIDDIKVALDNHGIEYKKSAKKPELLALLPEPLENKISKKIGYYQIMAQRLTVAEPEEDPMERGTRLEEEALKYFTEKTGKEASNELVLWVSDIHQSITYSPDGVVSDNEVTEVKCLNSAEHLYIYFEKDIPEKYMRQNIQAFVVNDQLEVLNFVCYDPRIPVLPFHMITLTREQLADEIEAHKRHQVKVLEMLEEDINTLTF